MGSWEQAGWGAYCPFLTRVVTTWSRRCLRIGRLPFQARESPTRPPVGGAAPRSPRLQDPRRHPQRPPDPGSLRGSGGQTARGPASTCSIR